MTVQKSPSSGGVGSVHVEPPVEMVTLTIDGVPVSVPKGSLVIRAAEKLGVEIPRFCDHPLLDPVGACRQCLVDVATAGPDGSLRKMPKPQAACTTTVSEGMSVETQHTSETADKAQKGVLEFLLINHPLDCPVCDKGGECPLQNQALSHGHAVSRFDDVKRTFTKPINVSTQVLLDRERCVLCQRCTRFSDQIAGDPFIALVERGAQQQIGIYQEDPFESYFSGNTVQICPVGALTGAAYRFRSRPFDLVSTPSACEHCAGGCGLRVDHRRGTVLRRMATNNPEVNEEWNCDKGRWAFTYATQPNRVPTPMIRENGELRPASWPEALAFAADGLAKAKKNGGVGVLTGGRLSVEDSYAYSKFARTVLETNDIDFRARPHSGEEASFLAACVAGSDAVTGVTYADLEQASAVFLVGLEPEEESPMVFLRLRKAWRKKGTPIFGIAPFATRGLSKLGGTLIPAAPGTETELLHALREKRPELSEAGHALGEGAVLLVGERLAGVPGALSAATVLAQSCGAKLAWIPRRAGERGALEAGCLPDLLPGGRPLRDNTARAELQKLWEVDEVPSATGRDAGSMMTAAAVGQLGGLVVGAVEISDLPDQGTVSEALQRAFVVSLEIRDSLATESADVVLPVAPVAEKTGAFLNWEGRVVPFTAALNSNAMADYRVLDLLAAEMGGYLGTRSVEQIRAELDSLPVWSGRRQAPPTADPQPVPSLAVGQAVLATWHQLLDAGRMQDGEPYLAGTAPLAVVRLSAATAAALDIVDGMAVTVSTMRGSITLPAQITPMVDHVVWLPTNSAGSRVRAILGADAGDVVTVTKGGAA
ncbi:NADH dehydrogenase subunit G [Austwickia chelonae]|uniref:NADH-quinone oxidoreductase n=1 Tax=Austwickia chelonae NBRC 105200 TaxID=1184607 RepID=K6V773_9MICO|nr:NADH-quinone oxidoreductase subunit G [Austwickia chelonae]GAB78053.1 NADH-quinone oxidoreductase subunit G [Austwickia chelonae NBRC 105200]SEV95257.1 NADH dehydrogenase subunit G [Austwickia chelonae]